MSLRRAMIFNLKNVNAFVFTDDFHAANTANINGRITTTGNKAWVQVPNGAFITIGIVSNLAVASGNGDLSDFYYIDCGKTDIELTAVLGAVGSNGFLILNGKDSNNRLQIQVGNLSTYQYVTGTPTLIYSGSGASIAGDTIKCVLSGTNLNLYRNGSLIHTITGIDLSQAGTKVGMFFYQDNTTSFSLIEAK